MALIVAIGYHSGNIALCAWLTAPAPATSLALMALIVAIGYHGRGGV
jgi:hypothetical protein